MQTLSITLHETKYYLSSTIEDEINNIKQNDIIYFEYDIYKNNLLEKDRLLKKNVGYLVNKIILEDNKKYVYILQEYENNIWKNIEINDNDTIRLEENNDNRINLYKYNKKKNFINTDLTNLIENIEIQIGGQTIDIHYSQWLDIYNELFEENHDYRIALNEGNINFLNINVNNVENIYIPLRFWFNKNIGLALPLISLQYHEVSIIVKMNNIIDINIVKTVLLVNYIYLDIDERRKFSELKHEYLIEQVQFTGDEILRNGVNHIDLNLW